MSQAEKIFEHLKKYPDQTPAEIAQATDLQQGSVSSYCSIMHSDGQLSRKSIDQRTKAYSYSVAVEKYSTPQRGKKNVPDRVARTHSVDLESMTLGEIRELYKELKSMFEPVVT